MVTKLIGEIFGEIDVANSKKKKLDILRKNDSPPLRYVLRGGFDPNIIWILPKTMPPYTPDDSPPGLSTTNLLLETRTFYLFCQQGVMHGQVDKNFSQIRRERLFIELLEKIPRSEAVIVMQMVQQNFHCRGLTANLVREAFPGLLPKEV